MYADLLRVAYVGKMWFNDVPAEERHGSSIVYNSQVLSVHNLRCSFHCDNKMLPCLPRATYSLLNYPENIGYNCDD
jgi:hypothetical protein